MPLNNNAVSRRAALLIAAAAFPAVLVIGVRPASAAVTFQVIDEGVATDPTVTTAPTTAAGYEAFLLQLTADSGQLVDTVDANTNGLGITGTLIQDFTPTTTRTGTTYTATPQSNSLNNTTLGIDSHFVVAPTIFTTAPTEDSDNTRPTNFPVANDNFDEFGSGKFLRGTFSFTPAAVVQLAYVVIKQGTTASFSIQAAEGATAAPTELDSLSGTIGTVASPAVISLTKTAPTTGFGTQVATLAVTGHDGSYNVSSSTPFAATGTGYVAVSGFNPGTDQEVYGLRVLDNGVVPSAAELTAIIGDINSAGGTVDTDGTILAANVTGTFAKEFPTADLLLTTAGNSVGNPFLGFNVTALNNATGIAGSLTVASVAAVPEPATVAALAVGAVGLLIGRRKRA